MSIPWRVLLRVYHRLEARGEIRGGRFVAGISGEQFALPDAVGMLRAIRRARCAGEFDFCERRRSFESRRHDHARQSNHRTHEQSHSLPGWRAHRGIRIGRDTFPRRVESRDGMESQGGVDAKSNATAVEILPATTSLRIADCRLRNLLGRLVLSTTDVTKKSAQIRNLR